MVKYVMRDISLDFEMAVTCDCGNTIVYYSVVDKVAICLECNREYKIVVAYTTATTVSEVTQVDTTC